MRIPVPNNRLVAFTLTGALLTAVVAGTLAVPGGGLTQAEQQADTPGTTTPDASQRVASDGPTPNQDFTPAVETRSGYEEHGEYEEHDEEYEDEDEDLFDATFGQFDIRLSAFPVSGVPALRQGDRRLQQSQ